MWVDLIWSPASGNSDSKKPQAKVKHDHPHDTPAQNSDFLGLLSSFRADLFYQMDLKLATLMSQHQVNQQQNMLPQKGKGLAMPTYQEMSLQPGRNYLQWPPLAT